MYYDLLHNIYDNLFWIAIDYEISSCQGICVKVIPKRSIHYITEVIIIKCRALLRWSPSTIEICISLYDLVFPYSPSVRVATVHCPMSIIQCSQFCVHLLPKTCVSPFVVLLFCQWRGYHALEKFQSCQFTMLLVIWTAPYHQCNLRRDRHPCSLTWELSHVPITNYFVYEMVKRLLAFDWNKNLWGSVRDLKHCTLIQQATIATDCFAQITALTVLNSVYRIVCYLFHNRIFCYTVQLKLGCMWLDVCLHNSVSGDFMKPKQLWDLLQLIA